MRPAAIAMLLLVAGEAHAGLVSDAWPPHGATIPTNGTIIVTNLLDTSVRAKLVSREGDVVLRPVKVLESSMGVQAVLEPGRPLSPCTHYELRIMVAGTYEPVEVLSAERHVVRIGWTTGAGPDVEAPRWVRPPRGVAASRRWEASDLLRDDVRVTVQIDTPVIDQGAVALLAEARPVRSEREPIRWFVGVDDGRATLEGGTTVPWPGPFDFAPDERFVLRLTAIDAGGNEVPAPGDALDIVGPATFFMNVIVAEPSPVPVSARALEPPRDRKAPLIAFLCVLAVITAALLSRWEP